MVNVHDRLDIDPLVDELTPWFETTFPEALMPVQKFGVGPSNTWKFEVRIGGPAIADPGVLRNLAAKVTEIVQASPLVKSRPTQAGKTSGSVSWMLPSKAPC